LIVWCSRQLRFTAFSTLHRGSVVVFGGGIPVWRNDVIIGAVGTGAGTVEQDVAVAEAAILAIDLDKQKNSSSDNLFHPTPP